LQRRLAEARQFRRGGNSRRLGVAFRQANRPRHPVIGADGRMATGLRLLNHRLLITYLHLWIEIDGRQYGKLSVAHKVAFEMNFLAASGLTNNSRLLRIF
jgi:hypothetical protein